ncbi:unnamed protein product [Closterium sp. NIES-65]|nr:unnamed protein product [Closterium sp. NIES-65]
MGAALHLCAEAGGDWRGGGGWRLEGWRRLATGGAEAGGDWRGGGGWRLEGRRRVATGGGEAGGDWRGGGGWRLEGRRRVATGGAEAGGDWRGGGGWRLEGRRRVATGGAEAGGDWRGGGGWRLEGRRRVATGGAEAGGDWRGGGRWRLEGRRRVATGGAEAAALHLRDGGSGMTHGRHHSGALLITARLRRNGEARREQCSCWRAHVHAASTPPKYVSVSLYSPNHLSPRHAEVRAWWDDARPAVTSVWLPPTRPADHALEGKPRRRRCDESSFSHVCWLLPLRPWVRAFTWGEEGEGAARRGSKRTSLLNPRLPSLQGLTWGEEGEGAARAHQGASLWLTPPLPFPSAWRAAWRQHGGRWGSARASRGVPLVNPPPSIPFSMAGVETTRRAARTEVDSWGEEGEGAARGSKRLLSNLPLPFPSAWRVARRSTRGAAQRAAQGQSWQGPRPEDRPRLRHRFCAAGVADGIGSDAARA